MGARLPCGADGNIFCEIWEEGGGLRSPRLSSCPLVLSLRTLRYHWVLTVVGSYHMFICFGGCEEQRSQFCAKIQRFISKLAISSHKLLLLEQRNVKRSARKATHLLLCRLFQMTKECRKSPNLTHLRKGQSNILSFSENVKAKLKW